MAYKRVTISLDLKIHEKLIAVRTKRISKGENVSFTQIVNEQLWKSFKRSFK
jgi:hypothetical protein